MEEVRASAFPRKRFFMEMFTRDISFEDCILDLIDNSIDSLVREKELDPAREILLTGTRSHASGSRTLPKVEVSLEVKEVSIKDNCGGIPPSLVLGEVFTFGHDPEVELNQQLGIYGVGLKRAIFKIAEEFEMLSTTKEGGFRAHLNIEEWSRRDETPDDWTVPIEYTKAAKRESEEGTSIRFSPLRNEVKMRLRDGAMLGKLTHSIAQTYCLFLEDHVRSR